VEILERFVQKWGSVGTSKLLRAARKKRGEMRLVVRQSVSNHPHAKEIQRGCGLLGIPVTNTRLNHMDNHKMQILLCI